MIRIVPYAAEHEPAVRAFNARIAAAHLDPSLYSSRFPEQYLSAWLPPRDDCDLHQEHFLALDDDGTVRGGYILKHQWFLIDGKSVRLSTHQLPISEGIIDSRYSAVALRLFADANSRASLLFALGGGGYHVPAIKFLLVAGWQATLVPFLFHVVRPKTFLQDIRVLRNSPAKSAGLDCLALSGVGWLGIKGLQRLRGRYRRPRDVAFDCLGQFDDWADDVWTRCQRAYSLIAVRDRCLLNVLYPGSDPRFIRLRVTRRGSPIGWAVLLSTRMSGHRQFGDMHVGTLVDCLAAPNDAREVTDCARDVLQSNGVDLIVSNQASEAWCRALGACGFLSGPSNFPFLASPNLADMLQPFEPTAKAAHLNRGDGDGPIHL